MLTQRLIDGANDALTLAQYDAEAMCKDERRRQSRVYDGIELLKRLLNEAIEQERRRIRAKERHDANH